MKILTEEYKECKNNCVAYDICEDKRLKHMTTYANGEIVDTVHGMGKYCIEHSFNIYKVGSNIK